jgi:hypothetical protein
MPRATVKPRLTSCSRSCARTGPGKTKRRARRCSSFLKHGVLSIRQRFPPGGSFPRCCFRERLFWGQTLEILKVCPTFRFVMNGEANGMQVGNKSYRLEADIPEQVPVFPLSGALLLPGSQLPLNIFEPRYLSMFDDAMSSHRLIGVIQPAMAEAESCKGPVEDLCRVGCLGRITSFAETGDGRYVITLGGVCRFRVGGEVEKGRKPYRTCRISPSWVILKPVMKGRKSTERRCSKASRPIWTPMTSRPTGTPSSGRAHRRLLIRCR